MFLDIYRLGESIEGHSYEIQPEDARSDCDAVREGACRASVEYPCAAACFRKRHRPDTLHDARDGVVPCVVARKRDRVSRDLVGDGTRDVNYVAGRGAVLNCVTCAILRNRRANSFRLPCGCDGRGELDRPGSSQRQRAGGQVERPGVEVKSD